MEEFAAVLPRTHAFCRQGMAEGLHLGVQLYVSLDGKPVADFALGESRPGVAMTPETIMLWLSSTKPLATAAVMQLVERDRLGLDDLVCRHIPEFGVQGKETITLGHLLTHTGGFRWVDTGWPDTTWDEIIARCCAVKLERGWTPGQKAGYHMQSSWYVLGELVRRSDGRFFSQYVRDEIFEPLGMHDSWVGMPVEQYQAYGERIGMMQNTERPGAPPHRWSSRQGCTDCSPGSNGYGPIRELVCLYEMLLGGGERAGRRILEPQSVAAMTARQRVGMFDETFKHVMDWGLGLIVDSNQYGPETVPYGYGRHASSRTFGHSGSQSSVGFADPQRGLAVGLVFNGTPGEVRHQARIREVLTALYEDLF